MALPQAVDNAIVCALKGLSKADTGEVPRHSSRSSTYLAHVATMTAVTCLLSLGTCDSKAMAAPEQSFPADFYVATATVIPVLFLAVAVQGRTYENMVSASIKYLRTFLQGRGVNRRQVGSYIAGVCSVTVAVLLILLPAAALAIALKDLANESDTSINRIFVWAATVALLVAVIIPPLIAAIRALVMLLKESSSSK